MVHYGSWILTWQSQLGDHMDVVVGDSAKVSYYLCGRDGPSACQFNLHEIGM